MPNSSSYPRTARLTTPAEFKQVFDKSKKIHFKEFTVYCHQRDINSARLGIAVSKKVDKRAVIRNTIKRVIRESFRIKHGQLPGWDIVIVARAAIKDLTNQQLTELLERVWHRIGLRCEN